MLASVLLDSCREAGIDFFTGVPDSQLSGLCNELYARYGTESAAHIVAHNEGGAIGLCAGHFLATGKPALCYMQNSGLGNAVNPLTSLTDPQVYSIPCLLVVGWRGEPGVKDEPQHVKQGAVTLSMLELLDIPYDILSAETTDEEFRAGFAGLLKTLREEKPAAIVVRKGALTSADKPDYRNGCPMSRETALSVILSAAGPEDVFISTTGKLSRELFELRESRKEKHDRDFLTVGSMGHASMIALRMAIDLPGRRVWCLDGDGAALMHLGALSLIGERAPGNLIHVVMNNGAHESVGGMPVCSRKLNLSGTAKASGYRDVYTARTEEDLQTALEKMLALPDAGPAMMEVCCACGSRADLGRPTTTPLQNRNALMDLFR